MQQGCKVGAVDSPGGGVRGWTQKRQRFLYNVQVTGCWRRTRVNYATFVLLNC
jgi:hypothetical protein